MKVLALITSAPRGCMVAIKFFLQPFLVSDYFVCRRTRATSAHPQPDDLLRPHADQKCLQALPRLAAHDAVAYHALAFGPIDLNPWLSITWQHQDQPASFQNLIPAGIYRLKRCQYPLAFSFGSGNGSCATAFDDLAKFRFQ